MVISPFMSLIWKYFSFLAVTAWAKEHFTGVKWPLIVQLVSNSPSSTGLIPSLLNWYNWDQRLAVWLQALFSGEVRSGQVRCMSLLTCPHRQPWQWWPRPVAVLHWSGHIGGTGSWTYTTLHCTALHCTALYCASTSAISSALQNRQVARVTAPEGSRALGEWVDDSLTVRQAGPGWSFILTIDRKWYHRNPRNNIGARKTVHSLKQDSSGYRKTWNILTSYSPPLPPHPAPRWTGDLPRAGKPWGPTSCSSWIEELGW